MDTRPILAPIAPNRVSIPHPAVQSCFLVGLRDNLLDGDDSDRREARMSDVISCVQLIIHRTLCETIPNVQKCRRALDPARCALAFSILPQYRPRRPSNENSLDVCYKTTEA